MDRLVISLRAGNTHAITLVESIKAWFDGDTAEYNETPPTTTSSTVVPPNKRPRFTKVTSAANPVARTLVHQPVLPSWHISTLALLRAMADDERIYVFMKLLIAARSGSDEWATFRRAYLSSDYDVDRLLWMIFDMCAFHIFLECPATFPRVASLETDEERGLDPRWYNYIGNMCSLFVQMKNAVPEAKAEVLACLRVFYNDPIDPLVPFIEHCCYFIKQVILEPPSLSEAIVNDIVRRLVEIGKYPAFGIVLEGLAIACVYFSEQLLGKLIRDIVAMASSLSNTVWSVLYALRNGFVRNISPTRQTMITTWITIDFDDYIEFDDLLPDLIRSDLLVLNTALNDPNVASQVIRNVYTRADRAVDILTAANFDAARDHSQSLTQHKPLSIHEQLHLNRSLPLGEFIAVIRALPPPTREDVAWYSRRDRARAYEMEKLIVIDPSPPPPGSMGPPPSRRPRLLSATDDADDDNITTEVEVVVIGRPGTVVVQRVKPSPLQLVEIIDDEKRFYRLFDLLPRMTKSMWLAVAPMLNEQRVINILRVIYARPAHNMDLTKIPRGVLQHVTRASLLHDPTLARWFQEFVGLMIIETHVSATQQTPRVSLDFIRIVTGSVVSVFCADASVNFGEFIGDYHRLVSCATDMLRMTGPFRAPAALVAAARAFITKRPTMAMSLFFLLRRLIHGMRDQRPVIAVLASLDGIPVVSGLAYAYRMGYLKNTLPDNQAKLNNVTANMKAGFISILGGLIRCRSLNLRAILASPTDYVARLINTAVYEESDSADDIIGVANVLGRASLHQSVSRNKRLSLGEFRRLVGAYPPTPEETILYAEDRMRSEIIVGLTLAQALMDMGD